MARNPAAQWALRGGIVLLLALGIPRLVLGGWRADLPPLVLLDVSRSMGPNRPRLPSPERVDSRIWFVAGGVQRAASRVEEVLVPREESHLAGALLEATGAFPGRDLLLVSDGRPTDAGLEEAARGVRKGGGRLFAALPDPAAADVGLLEARILHAGPPLSVQVVVASSTRGSVRVRLSRSGAVVDERLLLVVPGSRTRIALHGPSTPGIARGTWRVSLLPLLGTPDDDPANDLLPLADISPARRVLVWGDLPREALGGAGLEVEKVDLRPGGLSAADLIVVSNVPRAELRPRLAPLQRHVLDGGRLLVLGGPFAWSAGGWGESDFERTLLPLRVRQPEGNRLALLLALDRSGSMVEKDGLRRLARVVAEIVAELQVGERLAVLPFARSPSGLLGGGFVGVESDEVRLRLLSELDALEPAGGTNLMAAIVAGAAHLQQETAKAKRLLLLSDGDPDGGLDPQGLAAARTALEQAQAQFGAVLVGTDDLADRLEPLAAAPEDILTLREAGSLPEHLIRALAAIRRADERIDGPHVVTGSATDDPASWSALSPSWIHDLEVVSGAQVVATAHPAVRADQQHVFAGRRRLGGGEVWALAWGPESEPAGQPRLEAFASLRPLIERLAGEADRGLAASWEGGDLSVSLPSDAGRGRIALLPPGDPKDARFLVEQRPGVYRAAFDRQAPLGWRLGAPIHRMLRLPAQPPPESAACGVDRSRLERVASLGGGWLLERAEELPPPRIRGGILLAPLACLLAAILFGLERWATWRTRPGGT